MTSLAAVEYQNILFRKCIDSAVMINVSSLLMTREQAIRKREKLAAKLSSLGCPSRLSCSSA